jgi:hypothetical protein
MTGGRRALPPAPLVVHGNPVRRSGPSDGDLLDFSHAAVLLHPDDFDAADAHVDGCVVVSAMVSGTWRSVTSCTGSRASPCQCVWPLRCSPASFVCASVLGVSAFFASMSLHRVSVNAVRLPVLVKSLAC